MCRKFKLSFSPSMRSNMSYPDIHYVFYSKIISPKKNNQALDKTKFTSVKKYLSKNPKK